MTAAILQLTESLWVLPSRSMAYNAGALISAGRACLIDPGPHPDETARLAELVAAQGATIDTIVLTHSHWDHILGPERLPPAPLVAHAAYLGDVLASRERLLHEIERWEASFAYARTQPFVPPTPALLVDDWHELTVGALSLQLLHIPGHAADQLAIYEPASGALWAADTLSDLEIPFVSDSLVAYEHTLARLADLDIRVLVPGHGAPTSDPTEIAARLVADQAYLAELRQRLLATVAAGGSLEDAWATCADLTFRHPEQNANPHRLNVASVYIELGGAADPAMVGWSTSDE